MIAMHATQPVRMRVHARSSSRQAGFAARSAKPKRIVCNKGRVYLRNMIGKTVPTSRKLYKTIYILHLLVLASIIISPFDARAEYPERPITLVVCFPPGGGADISARLINVQFGDALGKPVIIENRGGGGGSIATVAVAHAKPDGYTLLMCSSAFVVNPSLYENAAYDPFKDFAPITVLAASPNVFVVPANSEIKTMAQFLAAAKANPGKLN